MNRQVRYFTSVSFDHAKWIAIDADLGDAGSSSDGVASPPPSPCTPEPTWRWAWTWAYGWGFKWLGDSLQSWHHWGWGFGAPGWGWANHADVSSACPPSEEPQQHAGRATGRRLQPTSPLLPTAAVAVSSVNWSPTSVTKNREAGAVLSGSAARTAATFMAAVFASDWAIATPLTVDRSTFTAASLAKITNTTPVAVTIPPSPNAHSSKGCHVTPSVPLTLPAGAAVTVAANPDHAYDELKQRFSLATATVEVYIYQARRGVR